MRDLAQNIDDFFAGAVDAISRIHPASDALHLLERLMHATASIGTTASLYTAAIPENEDETSSFSLFACDPGLAHRQHRLGSLLDHPWFQFARTHSTPGTDRQIPLPEESDTAAIELARQYGFTSCLVVPIPLAADSARVEMLCIGSGHTGAFEGEDARVVTADPDYPTLIVHQDPQLWSTARLHSTQCCWSISPGAQSTAPT